MTSEHCGGQREGRVICTQLLAIKAELATQAEVIYAACFDFKADDASSDAHYQHYTQYISKIMLYTLKNKVLSWHWWLPEEPLTSMETFSCTNSYPPHYSMQK